jgi:acyl transferase domain-containing protein
MLRDLACHFPPAHVAIADAERVFTARAGLPGTRLGERIYPFPAFSDTERRSQEEALRDTRVAQPALGAVSLAAWRVLELFGVRGDLFAGHSYGELTALCAAGRLGAEDFFALSVLRGRLMAAAEGGDAGAMLAVLAPLDDITRVLAEEGLDLVLANRNAPAQTVLSGPTPVIDKAEAAFAARRLMTRRLAVAAAFHSPLVAGARGPLRTALEEVAFRPGAAVFANSTAAPYPEEPAAARDLLAGQLARPVEFVAEVEALHAAGSRCFLEVGPGARLTGLVGAILGDRPHQARALDASSGKRGRFDLACVLAWLGACGYNNCLSLWDDGFRPAEAADARAGLVVPLCGANHVRPRPRRPAAATSATVHVNGQAGAFHGPQGTAIVKNGSRLDSGQPSPRLPPAATPAPTVLDQALQVTRESLAALQRMQEQTAQLHRQFLEGQEAAQRTVHVLVEQQQRLLQAALGIQALTPPAPSAVGQAFQPDASIRQAGKPDLREADRVGEGMADRVTAVLREVVSEKTGYPAEMLEPDMALDADLGIDSIKRVEILSALQERLPDAPPVRPEHLGSLLTLRHVADFLGGAATEASAERPFAEAGAPGTDHPRSPALERSLVRMTTVPEKSEPLHLPPGAEVWITSDDGDLSALLVRRLAEGGLRPRLLPCAALAEQPCPPQLGGLIVLAPSDGCGDTFLRNALLGAKQAAPGLQAAGQAGGALLATVSRLDGAFGLGDLSTEREPLDGALAGLAKTAGHEWPEVRCRALDLSRDWPNLDAAADALLAELFRAGPIEVGLSANGRRGLERVVQPLPEAALRPPLAPGGVVVLSGGARGVTAEAAIALARAFRPVIVLLGRSPAPAPEPADLAAMRDEVEIKRELARRGLPPRAIAAECRLLLAGREVRRTFDRLAALGVRAVYRSVDVRDAAAVAALLAEVQAELGPVRGLVHGAGVLADARIEDKTAEQFDRVFATKVNGLRHLLAAIRPEGLRFLVLFSSTTGRFGRAGQADYAMANEALNKLARQEARRLPDCRVVAVNWGPWDGGMVTPALKKVFAAEGVPLIPAADGAEFLVRELGSPAEKAVEVVVFGGPMPEAATSPAAAAPPTGAVLLPTAFERVLDLEGHPILGAHVLDGRPVLPLALTLEYLAHAALHHNPGLHFHGVDGLRALHAAALEGGGALTLRAGAGLAAKRDGLFVSPAELRGLGAGGRETLFARADVLLCPSLPPAPAAGPPLALPPAPFAVVEAYRGLLFHGPELHAIGRLEGCGPAGIVAAVRTAPAPALWIARPLRQRWLGDPLALDGVFQLLILWSQAQRGVPNLPCHVARYRQYRKAFPPDGVRVVLRLTRATDLLAVADVDLLDAAGVLLARLEGCEATLDAGLRRAFRSNRLSPVPLS